MSDIVRTLTMQGLKKRKVDDFKSGDTVGVYVRVREGEKERVQLYKGVVLKIQGSGTARAFTVRKISNGVGVERTFPFTSPAIDRVEVISRGKVRRSRLYFLRALKGKAAAIRSELVVAEGETAGDAASAQAAVVESAAPAKSE